MKFYEFTWRITEKHVHQEYQGYRDVIYYVGYDCLGEMKDYDPITETETWYSDTIVGKMEIPFNPSDSFTMLGSVDDDIIFDWLISNGLDRTGIEDTIRAKLDQMASN